MQKFIILSIILFSALARASVDLVEWQPQNNFPKLIFAKLENETPSKAISRYFHSVQSNVELNHLFKNYRIDKLDEQNFKGQLVQNIVASSGAELETTKLRVAVIANKASDLFQGDRIKRIIELVRKAGGVASVVAVSADIDLSKKDAQQFRELITKDFDVLIGLGGEDVDPALYGEEITHSSKNINSTRDLSELELIKAFKKEARGVYFGICRGHQIGAVADGHSLYQDIAKDGVDQTIDHSKWHRINVESSLLLRFLENQSNPIVNSVHHQAVRINPDAKSKSVANIGNVVEALESDNKMSFSVQFHPEFDEDLTENSEFSSLGFTMIKNILAYSRLKRAELLSPSAPRCRAVFRRIQ